MGAKDPYRRIARFYDRVVEPMQAGVRKVAFEVAPPEAGWSVLDVGCGTGTGLEQYLAAGCEVAGVDVSPAMLGKAEERLGDRAHLQLTDGSALPFEADTFDLVATTLVLHEVPAVARPGFVAEMARVARRDGRLLFVDYRFGSLRGLKGRAMRAVSTVAERFSGHYSGYRSFKADGGVPAVVDRARLGVEREKIIAGGNLAIYVVSPNPAQPQADQRRVEE